MHSEVGVTLGLEALAKSIYNFQAKLPISRLFEFFYLFHKHSSSGFRYSSPV